MPDILSVISRWWKLIAALVAAALIIAVLLLSMQPKLYAATATALPANSIAFDKAHIFNPNIEVLYEPLGSSDELDRILGTAELDTLYLAIADQQNLVNYYKVKKGKEARYSAAQELKEKSSIKRSEFGELKVRVWDQDPEMAALFANQLLQNLENIHQNIRNQTNARFLAQLTSDYENARNPTPGTDTFINNQPTDLRQAVQHQPAQLNIQQYEQLIAEYKTLVHAKPDVLFIVEHARPQANADKPKFVVSIMMALITALIAGVLIAVLLESRRKSS